MALHPIIGVTLDCEPAGGYAASPYYALRRNYGQAVADAGGIPVLLPHQTELADHYLDLLDGLMVTGGAFDLDPALYGAAIRHPTVSLKEDRTRFELAMLTGALARDMPVLGICGGQQLLNVALGGSLFQHIPDDVPGAMAHEGAGHPVSLVSGTRLAAIAGHSGLEVNSSHHQAVKDVAPGCVVNALAPDGVIEGIEDPARRFCLGVQWHPEYCVSPADAALLGAFVDACR